MVHKLVFHHPPDLREFKDEDRVEDSTGTNQPDLSNTSYNNLLRPDMPENLDKVLTVTQSRLETVMRQVGGSMAAHGSGGKSRSSHLE